MTSNPAIFEKSHQWRQHRLQHLLTSFAMPKSLMRKVFMKKSPYGDVQDAATSSPCLRRSKHYDGFVISKFRQLSPTTNQGHHRRSASPLENGDRPNLMVKVPATPEVFLRFAN